MSRTCAISFPGKRVAARSYLFVPGDRPDRFEKAWNSEADAVIIDLEDAVSVEEKPAAREATAAWLSPERPVYVRVNGAGTEWFADDLREIFRPGLAGVMLPKAEEPEQVAETASRLGDGTAVIPTLETALGVWNARPLAEAPGVERAEGDGGTQADETERSAEHPQQPAEGAEEAEEAPGAQRAEGDL